MNSDQDSYLDSPLQTWMSEDDSRGDFAGRIARQTALVADEHPPLEDIGSTSKRARSLHTSILVNTRSEDENNSMASDEIPALTRASSIRSTCSATCTDTAIAIDGGCMLESEDGILTLPTRLQPHADLLCPFQILECSDVFSDVVEFKLHVFSHFRGHPLPPYAVCFACGRPFFQQAADDNARSWNRLLSHMTYDHYRGGETVFRFRPDIAVMRYMWNRGIVSDAQFKRTQLESPETRLPVANNNEHMRRPTPPEAPMAPSAPIPAEIRHHLGRPSASVGSFDEPHTVFAGRRQDRRQADPMRLRARVRGNL